jgi:hypothetical protein
MSKKDSLGKKRPVVTGPLAFFAVAFGSAAVGTVTGGVIGIVAGLILRDELFGFGGLAGAMGGVLIGYPTGIVAGILLLKKWLRLEGSVLLSLPFSLAGAIIPLAISNPLGINAISALVAFFIATPVLGAVGFFLGSRRKK